MQFTFSRKIRKMPLFGLTDSGHSYLFNVTIEDDFGQN